MVQYLSSRKTERKHTDWLHSAKIASPRIKVGGNNGWIPGNRLIEFWLACYKEHNGKAHEWTDK